MRAFNKRVLSLFLVALVVLVSIPVTGFADGAQIVDPLGLPSYPASGSGSSYNYKTGINGSLSAEVQYDVMKGLGSITTGSSLTPQSVVPTVSVGDVIKLNFKLKYRPGHGDGANGNSENADLMLFVADPSNLAVKIGSYPNNITINNIHNVHLSLNHDIVVPEMTYTIPAAYAGSMVSIPYAIFDYGSFGGWKQTRTDEGVIKLLVNAQGSLNVTHTFNDDSSKNSQSVSAGNVGTAYTTSPVAHEGYTVNVPANATGNYTNGTTTVAYIYTKIVPQGTVKVTHTFSDDETKYSETNMSGDVDSTYTTSAVAHEGYTVNTPANATGNYTTGTTTVAYVYTKIIPQSTVKITHTFVGGTLSNQEQVISGAVGSSYTTSTVDHEGYTVAIPQNANGEFTAEEIIVAYVYTLKEVVTPPATTTAPTTTAPATTAPEVVPATTVPEVVPATTAPEVVPTTTIPVETAPTTTAPEVVALIERSFDDEPLNNVDVVEEPTPAAAPEATDAPVIEATEAAIVDIAVEAAPQGAIVPALQKVVVLPKTGEIPATLFYGIGGLLGSIGVFMRRKK